MPWDFTTPQGSFETTRVSRDVRDRGERGTGTVELRAVLEASQAKKVEESLGRQAAVAEREVPDGESFVQDTTGGDNEFTIYPPAGGDDLFTPGTYVVESWESEWRDSQFYEVKLEVSLKSAVSGFGRLFAHSFGE